MSQASLEALTSIEWKNYGLVLKSVGDQDGVTLLEWENLPPCSYIDIVLHRYHKQYPHYCGEQYASSSLVSEYCKGTMECWSVAVTRDAYTYCFFFFS